ncbi:MAG: ribosome-associated translation inhibitor RaiA [Alphaproteobacteria bacterium]|nr:ribosome-associated translation inhibitor RaiA [Alphaproteobacteria bacterium]
MQISVKGKQLDVGDSLRAHVEENIDTMVSKYFEAAINANVVFSKEGSQIKTDISIHPKRNLVIQGKSKGTDPYATFDAASDRVASQLRRYKERIKSHKGQESDFVHAQKYILETETGEELSAAITNPVIVAEKTTDLPNCSVSEAVMRMELEHVNALMFYNTKNNNLNVVYKREDGHIGWVDPNVKSDS